MKRVVLLVLALCLSGCSISKEAQFEVIDKSSVHIAMPNVAYAKALESLWNQMYPQYGGVLVFDQKPASELVGFQSDIEWVSDTQAVYKTYLASTFEQKGYRIPKSLHREELEGIFTPIQATGYLFAYDDEQLQNNEIEKDALSSFEELAEQGKGKYYYQHTVEGMLPLWGHGIQDQLHTMDQPIDEEELQQTITRFQSLYQEMGFVDNPWLSADQIFPTYAFALVDPQQMKETQAYRKGTLHFASMPKYQKKSCAPYAQTYGFIASKDCQYSEIIQCFMDMVRSQQGLQAFLDTGEDVAVVDQRDRKDFTIYDARRKEMIIAMNDSTLWDISVVKEKTGISMKSIYEQGDLTSILQNGICAKKSATAIQEEMSQTLVKWIKQQ